MESPFRSPGVSNFMIASLALSILAIASGTLLTYEYDEGAPLASRLCSGACIGFAAMALAGFVIALFFGLNAFSIGLTSLILAIPLLLLTRVATRDQLNDDINQALKAISRASTKPDRWAFIYFLFYAGVMIVMWLVFDRALLDKPEGYYTGVLNNYGDLPFHLSVITRFAFGQNYPPEDPTFAGARFTYPFLTDFVSAIFVRLGATMRQSLFIENWIIGVALVGVLHRFGLRLVRNRTALVDAVWRRQQIGQRCLSHPEPHRTFIHNPARRGAGLALGKCGDESPRSSTRVLVGNSARRACVHAVVAGDAGQEVSTARVSGWVQEAP